MNELLSVLRSESHMLKITSNQQIVKPRAVILDTDNTLYPYDVANQAATKEVAKKVVELLGVDEMSFRNAYTEARQEIKAQLNFTASSHSRLLYYQRAIEKLGMGTRILHALDLEQTYWRSFLTHTQLFPGAVDFLQKLKSDNVKTANITDLTAQIQFRKIIYFGLDELFDYVVSSEESGADKPHIKSFKLALDKLSIDPSKVWMIGDNADADIAGGNLCGMITIQKVHNGVALGKSENTPYIVFDDFQELMGYYSNL